MPAARPLSPPLRVLVTFATALTVVFGLGIGPAATSADAASNRTWKRLANCESGGRWHINTGDRYYGGLQFSLSTWRSAHGNQFARYQHRASKGEQITVAKPAARQAGLPAVELAPHALTADGRSTDEPSVAGPDDMRA